MLSFQFSSAPSATATALSWGPNKKRLTGLGRSCSSGRPEQNRSPRCRQWLNGMRTVQLCSVLQGTLSATKCHQATEHHLLQLWSEAIPDGILLFLVQGEEEQHAESRDADDPLLYRSHGVVQDVKPEFSSRASERSRNSSRAGRNAQCAEPRGSGRRSTSGAWRPRSSGRLCKLGRPFVVLWCHKCLASLLSRASRPFRQMATPKAAANLAGHRIARQASSRVAPAKARGKRNRKGCQQQRAQVAPWLHLCHPERKGPTTNSARQQPKTPRSASEPMQNCMPPSGHSMASMATGRLPGRHQNFAAAKAQSIKPNRETADIRLQEKQMIKTLLSFLLS